MVLGCLLDWPAVRPCRLAVCRTSTINRWTSRLRPEGHTCSFGGSRPVPICHLHLRSFANRHQEVADSGITEVVFFHSAADALRGYQSLLPFAVIADPDRVQYREFGVEKSLGAITHPRALWAAVRGSAAMLHRNDPERAGVGFGDGTTHLGLPADFLLDADGTVAAVHYGRHADDQWSVDQLIDINRSLGGKGTQ
ncbi:hypothetical protein P931_02925 [Mycobacterium tuberculosis KT-0028]|nr:hypothetical protein P931_02925 [Mycobacterium tuberculosis KT-0028]